MQDGMHIISRGICLQPEDLSYVKEGFRLLIMNGGCEQVLEIWPQLDESIRREGRMRLYYIRALADSGQNEETYRILTENGGLRVDDIREGEVSLSDMWKTLRNRLGYEDKSVPEQFDFTVI